MTTPAEINEVAKQLETLSELELNSVGLTYESLLAVIEDNSSSLLARLYACEILLRRDQTKFLSLIGVRRVAAIYVAALKDRVTTDLNPWAFLNMDELGPFGRTLVACSQSAVVELVPLLDIQRLAGLYSGSAEAKEGNADQARVCDFAAFFIAKIKHVPYRFYRNDEALRDAEINQLKKKL